MFEEVTVTDVVTIVVPTVVGVAVIGVLTLLAFWLGSGQQRSYEEAMARATKEAEKVISKEREKLSPRGIRKKKTKRKKGAVAEEEESPPAPPLKPILKNSGVKPPTPQPERSPQKYVEFQLDSPPRREEGRTPLFNPPTPHPVKQPVFGTTSSKIEELPAAAPTKPEHSKPQPSNPPPPAVQRPPPAAVQKPPPPAVQKPPPLALQKPPPPQVSKVTDSSGSQKRSRQKARQLVDSFDLAEALPASRILEIVGASSLSDDDIQQLIEQLLVKMNANAEWQAASLRTESVKSLKKLNQEIQSRCDEAEKTVRAHSNKIRELRSEIQQERARHQASENSLQGRITQYLNEQQVTRTKITGLEEELKQTKALPTSHTMQQLQEDNGTLQTQLTTLAQQNSSLNSQLAMQTKQLQEHQEAHLAVKNDLRRAKEALKSSNDTQPLRNRIAELEVAVNTLEGDNTSLQSEIESLKQWGAPPSQEEGEGEGVEEVRAELEARHAENVLALRSELEGKRIEEVARVRVESAREAATQRSEHEGEVQGLREALDRAERETEELRQLEELRHLKEQEKGRMVVEEPVLVEEPVMVEECVLVEEQAPQFTEQPLEELLNGSVEDRDEGKSAVVSLEEHEKLVKQKEELIDQVKELEKKLEELKLKNNTLRDNCWKARDAAAASEKSSEQKLRQAYKDAEQRCKRAKTEALAEARDAQKSFLQQLFPEIAVDEEVFSSWLDEFESQVQEKLEHMEKEVSSLQSKVEELRKNEKSSIQEAENFRQTLETTMGIMSRLQEEVDRSTEEHQETLQEKDQMIERERFSNRSLQEQLCQEKDAVSKLQKELEEEEDSSAVVEELEQSLQDAKNHYTTAQMEAETLRHSLHHELEMKAQIELQMEEMTERCKQLEEAQVKAEADQSKKNEEEAETLRHSLHHELEMKAQMKLQMEEMTKRCEELEAKETDQSKKNEEMAEEVQLLQRKLQEAEDRLELAKTSNRELNARIDILDPSLAAGSSEV